MADPTINNFAALEALLFVHGEPLSLKDIAQALSWEEAEARSIIADYGKALGGEDRGLMLLTHGEKVQLATKAQFAQFLAHFVKEELAGDLTPASVETLALVAYLGPVSRATIDYHRGVNSTFILRNLALRGLVARVDDPAHPNAVLFEASFDLLKHLGLSQKESLPEYEKFHEVFKSKQSALTNN